MKRSEINRAFRLAAAHFGQQGWALPPRPRWDITDFGLGIFDRVGLTLITLAAEPEYCEKLMYVQAGQRTPCHTHAKKKEDIICRSGRLALWLWSSRPGSEEDGAGRCREVAIDGRVEPISPSVPLELAAGQRVTLVPGLWHAFEAKGGDCVIGEVSTANDDRHDNFFLNPAVGRFSRIEEDEPAQVSLVGE